MNCEIELDLSWTKDCELMEYSGILAGCLFFHSKKLTVILQEVLFFKCFFLGEIKDFNALINNKPFFDQPVKNKQEEYEKLVKILRNNDYATGNLLDYLYHQNYYMLIGISLSRQTNRTTY